MKKLAKVVGLALAIGTLYAIVASDHTFLRAAVILAAFAASLALENSKT